MQFRANPTTETDIQANRAATGRRFGVLRNPAVHLWAAQGVLALLFLFAGITKLVVSSETLADQTDLPVAFMRFIGAAEALGALGLLLPGLLRIRPVLTPVAAAGLVVIMAGATVVTVIDGSILAAAVPAGVGLLAAFVADRRARRVWQPGQTSTAAASATASAPAAANWTFT